MLGIVPILVIIIRILATTNISESYKIYTDFSTAATIKVIGIYITVYIFDCLHLGSCNYI